jgi:predicted ATPase
MIITRLILQNWMNFKDVDLPLNERMFIVGANASGKSNLLDSLRFLRDIAKPDGGLQYAVVTKRGGVSKLRCLSARANPDVSIEVHLAEDADCKRPEWKYRLSFRHSGGGIMRNEAKVVEEKVWSGKASKWITTRSAKNKKETANSLKATFLEQPVVNQKFQQLYSFFQKLQYLHVVPQLVREADSYVLAAGKEDFYGRNLIERIAITNQKTRNSYLAKINQVLKLAVPQLENLGYIPDEKKGIPHLEARYKHWRAQGARQQEMQFSDGTLRLIGFLWALLDGTDTILLEEPELYLHASIVKKLPEFISSMQRKKDRIRQVLITTHSYEMLSDQGIGQKELVLLRPGNEGTIVTTAAESQEIKEYLESGFSPAEAVLSQTAPEKIDELTKIKNN